MPVSGVPNVYSDWSGLTRSSEIAVQVYSASMPWGGETTRTLSPTWNDSAFTSSRCKSTALMVMVIVSFRRFCRFPFAISSSFDASFASNSVTPQMRP